jgi:hypothetical protein
MHRNARLHVGLAMLCWIRLRSCYNGHLPIVQYLVSQQADACKRTDFEHVELSFCEILMNFDGSCDAVASLNEPIQLGLVLRGVADPIWGDEDP